MNDNAYRANYQIKISPVILINQEGKNLGPIPLVKAQAIAKECELDLVEIVPNNKPPICRLMDFGKFKFEQNLKEKKQKKKQSKLSQVKEVRLSPGIQNHDLETKNKSVRKFIQLGHKVVVKLEFKRRELNHKELGDKVLKEFISSLSDVCSVVEKPKFESKSINCMLTPKIEKEL